MVPRVRLIRKDGANDVAGELKRMYLHEYIHLKTDTDKPETVMVVTRVIGGWIYEMAGNDSIKMWKPVFVPEQVNISSEIKDALDHAINRLANEDWIRVKQC